jgi:hypothetical protein
VNTVFVRSVICRPKKWEYNEMTIIYYGRGSDPHIRHPDIHAVHSEKNSSTTKEDLLTIETLGH